VLHSRYLRARRARSRLRTTVSVRYGQPRTTSVRPIACGSLCAAVLDVRWRVMATGIGDLAHRAIGDWHLDLTQYLL